MSDGYIAFVIDDESRQKLLKAFPPKYADVIAHHITFAYGVSDQAPLPPQPLKIVVRGYHDSGAIQVLVVEIDGRKNQAGDKNNFYHITLSLDRAQGVSPKDSNDVLQKVIAEGGESALYNLREPIEISATPRFIENEPAAPQKTKRPQIKRPAPKF